MHADMYTKMGATYDALNAIVQSIAKTKRHAPYAEIRIVFFMIKRPIYFFAVGAAFRAQSRNESAQLCDAHERLQGCTQGFKVTVKFHAELRAKTA